MGDLLRSAGDGEDMELTHAGYGFYQDKEGNYWAYYSNEVSWNVDLETARLSDFSLLY